MVRFGEQVKSHQKSRRFFQHAEHPPTIAYAVMVCLWNEASCFASQQTSEWRYFSPHCVTRALIKLASVGYETSMWDGASVIRWMRYSLCGSVVRAIEATFRGTLAVHDALAGAFPLSSHGKKSQPCKPEVGCHVCPKLKHLSNTCHPHGFYLFSEQQRFCFI